MFAVQERGDDGVQPHGLALSRGSGDQQVRHLGQVEDVIFVLDRAPDHHRKLGLRLLETQRTHGRIHRNHLLVAVGNLDADGSLARNRRDDADTQRLEALRNIVFEALHLRDLDSLRLHDLVERHRGTHRGLDALDRNAEIFERLLDLGLVLENLLVRDLRIGNVVLQQRHGRLAVVHQVLQRVVALRGDRLLVEQFRLVGLDRHHDALRLRGGRIVQHGDLGKGRIGIGLCGLPLRNLLRGRLRRHGVAHRRAFQLDQPAAADHHTALGTRKVHLDELPVLRGRGRLLRGSLPGDGFPVGRQFEEGIFVLFRRGLPGRNGLRRTFHTDRGGFLRRGFRRFRRRGLRCGRLRPGFRSRFGNILRNPVLPGRTSVRHDFVLEDLDDLPALIDHHVARLVDLVDEVAVDENTRQYPAADKQDQRSESPDMRAQQGRRGDAESAAPPRRAAEAPAVGEGESQRQRPQDHNQEQRKDRMVEQQRPLTDDPHADQHDHRGNQNAEKPERMIDQQHPQPRSGPAAEIFRFDAERHPFLDRFLQPALVGGPAEKRKEHRSGGEQTDEQQQQSGDPARTVAVGTLNGLPAVGGCIFRCHSRMSLLSSEGTNFFRQFRRRRKLFNRPERFRPEAFPPANEGEGMEPGASYRYAATFRSRRRR